MPHLARTTIARASPDALRYLRSVVAAPADPSAPTTSIHRARCYSCTSTSSQVKGSVPTPHLRPKRQYSISQRPQSDSPVATTNQPQTYYDFFPQTLPSGPPPSGSFSLDLRALRSEFLKLQAQAHPDRHPGATKSQAQALSARINEAYKTLQSPLLRAQYILSLRGETSHQDDAAKLGDASEDQELLMEVLELREAIEEAEGQGEIDALKVENEERVKESVLVLEEAFQRDDIETARREAVRLRYWVNVEETLHAWEEGKPAPLLQH